MADGKAGTFLKCSQLNACFFNITVHHQFDILLTCSSISVLIMISAVLS